MLEDSEKDTEQKIIEKFDRFVRDELLKAANEIREEEGLPILTEFDVNSLDITVATDKNDEHKKD